MNKSVECGFCKKAGPMYSWTCPGCRARMLISLPSREARARWVERWRIKGDEAMADKVIAILKLMKDVCAN